MTFSEFCDWVNGFSGERPEHIRLGQHAFNLLNEQFPAIANSYRGDDLDPFYDDNKIPAFMSDILQNYVATADLFFAQLKFIGKTFIGTLDSKNIDHVASGYAQLPNGKQAWIRITEVHSKSEEKRISAQSGE
jgi:hypothetical protein